MPQRAYTESKFVFILQGPSKILNAASFLCRDANLLPYKALRRFLMLARSLFGLHVAAYAPVLCCFWVTNFNLALNAIWLST